MNILLTDCSISSPVTYIEIRFFHTNCVSYFASGAVTIEQRSISCSYRYGSEMCRIHVLYTVCSIVIDRGGSSREYIYERLL
ncbi:hypothetical protein E2986_10443 [Frieseomelitta varia]|uniref:Uncharacterized protein n=1 Tax=Frieseomelitta varia TaxID=561572 RepID=A0A833S3R3_9HYME|nr:hypothetical protein E2986_10443 [Frieseomelitta varia]